MLPVDCAITPGVAKIPEPMTLEMMRKYADVEVMFRPTVAASGMVLSSVDGVLGVRSGVRSGVLRFELPCGDSKEACSYLEVLIDMNRTGFNRLPTLGMERNSGSSEPVSEMAKKESASEMLGESKGEKAEGTILSRNH